MPLYDFDCQACHREFEQIVRSANDTEAGVCPHCGKAGAIRRVARFKVGGRGDLRESTAFHGCHAPLDTDSGSSGHVHGPGCGHHKSGPKE